MVLDLSTVDFSGLTPDEFARMVKQASKGELEAAMSGPHRRAVLDEVFGRMSSRLRAERAGTLSAVIRWTITGDPADEYEQVIDNGTCTVGAPTAAKPRLSITTDPVSFLKLVSGNASGPALFMTRKLKLAGDLALGAGLTSYFDIPKA
ncbi:SCP2 sterol-binding domain-containing protein [Actinocatenispora comari]|uniref:Sterol-binding protein n=1 Tax=Actinocatenispora comari TaxID=2807577 RepID=A0A8J4AJ25_9ACTN|nr:SCP2 sterol-binding domain-containing protein [Actinocatenispora comari]GIL31500.1 sterol-binding protein [Actinocatenispora comari]